MFPCNTDNDYWHNAACGGQGLNVAWNSEHQGGKVHKGHVRIVAHAIFQGVYGALPKWAWSNTVSGSFLSFLASAWLLFGFLLYLS